MGIPVEVPEPSTVIFIGFAYSSWFSLLTHAANQVRRLWSRTFLGEIYCANGSQLGAGSLFVCAWIDLWGCDHALKTVDGSLPFPERCIQVTQQIQGLDKMTIALQRFD
jgi:hypothetical protein